jgi:hypothetical protein
VRLLVRFALLVIVGLALFSMFNNALKPTIDILKIQQPPISRAPLAEPLQAGLCDIAAKAHNVAIGPTSSVEQTSAVYEAVQEAASHYIVSHPSNTELADHALKYVMDYPAQRKAWKRDLDLIVHDCRRLR